MDQGLPRTVSGEDLLSYMVSLCGLIMSLPLHHQPDQQPAYDTKPHQDDVCLVLFSVALLGQQMRAIVILPELCHGCCCRRSAVLRSCRGVVQIVFCCCCQSIRPLCSGHVPQLGAADSVSDVEAGATPYSQQQQHKSTIRNLHSRKVDCCLCSIVLPGDSEHSQVALGRTCGVHLTVAFQTPAGPCRHRSKR